MSDHKTVIGVCESVEINGDWHKFNIRHEGSQYPLKLSTKKPELVELARAVGKQKAEWGFLEQQGNENPNKPGTHFINRYLDSAAVVNGEQPQQFEAIPDELKQQLIVRQVCLKAAVDLRSASVVDGVLVPTKTVLEAADLFYAWVMQQPPAILKTKDDPPFQTLPEPDEDLPF